MRSASASSSDRLGELGAQAVLADGDLDLDAGVALAADDLLDVALRRVVARGVAGESDDDDVAGRRIPDRVGGDEDVVADAAVGGVTMPMAPALSKRPTTVVFARSMIRVTTPERPSRPRCVSGRIADRVAVHRAGGVACRR